MEIRDALFIAGDWVAPAKDATLEVVSPVNFKSSGLGRECGREGLAAYQEIQTILLPPGYAPAGSVMAL